MDIKVEPKLEPDAEQIFGEFDFPRTVSPELLIPNLLTLPPHVEESQKSLVGTGWVKSEDSQFYVTEDDALNINRDEGTCYLCNVEFRGLKSLKHHWAMKHRGKMMFKKEEKLICEICSKELFSSINYNRHMLSHRTVMMCDVCGSESHTFRDRGSLKRHLILIHGYKIYAPDSHFAKTYKCEICSKEFKIKTSYTHHLRIHMEDRPMFQCPECPSKLATKSSYFSHVKYTHTTDAPDLECDICGIVMKRGSCLAYHKRTRHEMKMTYSCSECPATFAGKPSFLKHCSEHKSGYLNCRFCGEVLQNGLSRISHERRNHYEEYRQTRPLKSKEIMICDQCDKPCKGRELFKTHILFRHTNKYRFFCDICGWKFKLRSQLTEHLLRHQGRFIFYCDDCGYGWKSREGLFKHSMKHHVGKPEKTRYEIEMEKTVDETVTYAMQGLYDDYNEYFQNESNDSTNVEMDTVLSTFDSRPTETSNNTKSKEKILAAPPALKRKTRKKQRQRNSFGPLNSTLASKLERHGSTVAIPRTNVLLSTVSPMKFRKNNRNNNFGRSNFGNTSLIPGIVVREGSWEATTGTKLGNQQPAQPVQIMMTSVRPCYEQQSQPTQVRRKGLIPLAPKITPDQLAQMSQTVQFRNTAMVPQAYIPVPVVQATLLIPNQPTQVQNSQQFSGALPILYKRPDFTTFVSQKDVGVVIPKEEEDKAKAEHMPSSMNEDDVTPQDNDGYPWQESPAYNGLKSPSFGTFDSCIGRETFGAENCGSEQFGARDVGGENFGDHSMVLDKNYVEQLVDETCETEISGREFSEKLVEQEIAEMAARSTNRTLPAETPSPDESSDEELSTMPNLSPAPNFCESGKKVAGTDSAKTEIPSNPASLLKSNKFAHFGEPRREGLHQEFTKNRVIPHVKPSLTPVSNFQNISGDSSHMWSSRHQKLEPHRMTPMMKKAYLDSFYKRYHRDRLSTFAEKQFDALNRFRRLNECQKPIRTYKKAIRHNKKRQAQIVTRQLGHTYAHEPELWKLPGAEETMEDGTTEEATQPEISQPLSSTNLTLQQQFLQHQQLQQQQKRFQQIYQQKQRMSLSRGVDGRQSNPPVFARNLSPDLVSGVQSRTVNATTPAKTTSTNSRTQTTTTSTSSSKTTKPSVASVALSKVWFSDHGPVVSRKAPTPMEYAEHGRVLFPKPDTLEDLIMDEKTNQARDKTNKFNLEELAEQINQAKNEYFNKPKLNYSMPIINQRLQRQQAAVQRMEPLSGSDVVVLRCVPNQIRVVPSILKRSKDRRKQILPKD